MHFLSKRYTFSKIKYTGCFYKHVPNLDVYTFVQTLHIFFTITASDSVYFGKMYYSANTMYHDVIINI